MKSKYIYQYRRPSRRVKLSIPINVVCNNLQKTKKKKINWLFTPECDFCMIVLQPFFLKPESFTVSHSVYSMYLPICLVFTQ